MQDCEKGEGFTFSQLHSGALLGPQLPIIIFYVRTITNRGLQKDMYELQNPYRHCHTVGYILKHW